MRTLEELASSPVAAAAAAAAAIALLVGFVLGKAWRRAAANRGGGRRRPPVVRAILISLAVHAAIVFILSLNVVSEAVYRAVKMPEREEVSIRTDVLAKEQLALAIRETVAPLPPVAPPEAAPQETFSPPQLDTEADDDSPRPPLPDATGRAWQQPATTPAAQPEPPADRLADRFRPTTAGPDLSVPGAAPDVAIVLDSSPVREKPEPPPAENPAVPRPAPSALALASAPSALPGVAVPELPLPSSPAPRIADALRQEPAPVRSARALPLPPVMVSVVEDADAPPLPAIETAGREAPSAGAEPAEAAGGQAAAPPPVASPLGAPLPSMEGALESPSTAIELPMPELVASATPAQQPDTAAKASDPRPAPLPDLPSIREASPPRVLPEVVLDSPPVAHDRFRLRDPELRREAIVQLGGAPETEEAIERALEWLAKNQEGDGHWSIARFGGEDGHDVAATGLGALAFMAWGAAPDEGGPYQDTVRRALDWLVASTGPDGDLRGGGEGKRPGDMYDHGIGAIALAEGYALTGDPRLRDASQRATAFIVEAQSSHDGGWRYRPGDHGDTSVFGWQVMALASARLAGLEVPEDTLTRARGWLDRVGGGSHGGLYGYQDKNPKRAMVAEGMFSRQLLGTARDAPAMMESAAWLAEQPPSTNDRDYYYWYYGALALCHHQGASWQLWNAELRPALLELQRTDGNDAGTWNPDGPFGNRMGRVVSTALATLTLEVYYRYLGY